LQLRNLHDPNSSPNPPITIDPFLPRREFPLPESDKKVCQPKASPLPISLETPRLNFSGLDDDEQHLHPSLCVPLTLPPAMSIASKAASSLARHAARQQAAAPSMLCSSSVAMQKRNLADASTSHAEWNSPFSRGTSGQQDTTKIPSFKGYKRGSETANKVFQYFMVGTFGGLSAMGAKDTVASEFGQIY
jgi:hypothetical protein